MSAGVLVRTAEPADAAGMARAWLDAGRYYSALDPAVFRVPDADRLAEFFAALPVPENAVTFVAELGGRVVGFASARCERPDEDARFQLVAELAATRVVTDALVVAEDARGQGAGTALMVAVHEWAAARGARVAVVDTYADSPLSVPFYRGLGYRPQSLSFRLPLGPS